MSDLELLTKIGELIAPVQQELEELRRLVAGSSTHGGKAVKGYIDIPVFRKYTGKTAKQVQDLRKQHPQWFRVSATSKGEKQPRYQVNWDAYQRFS